MCASYICEVDEYYCKIRLYVHHHIQCIPLIENYVQGLGREERRHLIPVEESAVKEPIGLRKVFKEKPTTYK